MRKKKPYAFEPVPGIDTLKVSDDSNDQSNKINVESVHSIIVDIIKEICDQIAINDDQLNFEAVPEVNIKMNQDDPCFSKLNEIMENVLDLEKQINAFVGGKDSKDYRFLDEMLTRNLLALDGIETAGRDDVRQQRKESIKSINRCLSILESKAKTNQAEKNNAILSDLAQHK